MKKEIVVSIKEMAEAINIVSVEEMTRARKELDTIKSSATYRDVTSLTAQLKRVTAERDSLAVKVEENAKRAHNFEANAYYARKNVEKAEARADFAEKVKNEQYVKNVELKGQNSLLEAKIEELKNENLKQSQEMTKQTEAMNKLVEISANQYEIINSLRDYIIKHDLESDAKLDKILDIIENSKSCDKKETEHIEMLVNKVRTSGKIEGQELEDLRVYLVMNKDNERGVNGIAQLIQMNSDLSFYKYFCTCSEKSAQEKLRRYARNLFGDTPIHAWGA